MKKIIVILSVLILVTGIIPQRTFAQALEGCTGTAQGSCSDGRQECLPDPRPPAQQTVTNPPATGKVCLRQGSALFSQASRSSTEIYMQGPQGPLESVVGYFPLAIQGENGEGIGGAAAILRYTAMMYQNKPASTGQYLADVKRTIGFPVKTAYAQGFGFESLSPILNLWKLARNIALVGFVVIFVVIGIMIMLRTKIDPRTVVTIQQAIPKIIVSMILVIFSYAICGFLIDTVMVGTRLGARLLQTNGFIGVSGDEAQKINALTNANIFKLWDQLYNVDELLDSFSTLGDDFNFIAGALGFDALLDGGITRTVLFIAMFIALLRTFYLLLTSYLTVTFKIITSPLQFLMFAIPGQAGGFSQWLRSMMVNLLVFPLVFFMLSFAAIFVAKNNKDNIVWYQNPTYQHFNTLQPRDNVWSVGQESFPEDSRYWAPPALGNWGATVGPLLSLAVLLTIPKAGDILKEALQHKGSSVEGAAGEGLQKAASRIPLLGSLTKM